MNKWRMFYFPRGDFRHAADVDRIVRICAARSVLVSPHDAQSAWEEYSDSMAAGWLGLGSDDEVYEDVMRYLVEIQ